jgi:DNA-directed RNA polymerase subunit RPC12/RpoP
MVKLDGWRCARCRHEWLPRVKIIAPKVCPKCKSHYWNKERTNRRPDKEIEAKAGVE